jgi:hypothetical protein
MLKKFIEPIDSNRTELGNAALQDIIPSNNTMLIQVEAAHESRSSSTIRVSRNARKVACRKYSNSSSTPSFSLVLLRKCSESRGKALFSDANERLVI